MQIDLKEHFPDLAGALFAITHHVFLFAPSDLTLADMAMNAAVTGFVGGAGGYIAKLGFDYLINLIKSKKDE